MSEQTPRDQQRAQNRLDPLATPPPVPESLVYEDAEVPEDQTQVTGDQRPADEPAQDDPAAR